MIEKLRNSYAVGLLCSDKRGECLIFPKHSIDSPEFLDLLTVINSLNKCNECTWSVTQYGRFNEDLSLFIDDYMFKYFDFNEDGRV